MLKRCEDKGTEEIGLVTPTLGIPQPTWLNTGGDRTLMQRDFDNNYRQKVIAGYTVP